MDFLPINYSNNRPNWVAIGSELCIIEDLGAIQPLGSKEIFMRTQFASNRLKDAILSEVTASVSSVSVYNSPCDSVNEIIALIAELKGGGLNDERVISAFTKAIDSLCKTSDNTALTKKRCKHIASMLVVYLGTIWE